MVLFSVFFHPAKIGIFVFILNYMKKNIIISILFCVVIVAGIILLVAKSAPPSDGETNSGESVAGFLSADETYFDFGTVSMSKGKISHDFKIRNTSTNPATIKKVYTSCMCTSAILKMGDEQMGPYGMIGHGAIPTINKMMAVGEEATISVVFDPNAHGPAGVGLIQRTVTVENDGKPIEFSFKVIVTP